MRGRIHGAGSRRLRAARSSARRWLREIWLNGYRRMCCSRRISAMSVSFGAAPSRCCEK
jgi:hypothetical protein